jgi:hypothetical protein
LICHRAIRPSARAELPRKRKVKNLKIGTHIFEGILGVRSPTGLSSVGVGSACPNAASNGRQLRGAALRMPAQRAGCALYEIDPTTGATIEIFYADGAFARSFGARGAGFYWRKRGCSPDVPSGPFIVCLDAYRDALHARKEQFVKGLLYEQSST